MTWKTFAYSIKKSELMDRAPAKIVIALFESAEYIPNGEDGLTEYAVRKWFYDDKRCHGLKYFPNGKLENPQGVYKFFRNRPISKLEKLQEILREVKDNDSPIDCETEDMDRFCWSLVNQFLDMLGFVRLDMPATEMTLKNIADTIEDKNSSNADQSPITSSKEDTRQENVQHKNAGAQISIPHDCRVCFCCKYWKGGVEVIRNDIAEEYGECKVFGEKVLCTDGIDCDTFRESYGRITLYELYRNNRH